MIALINPLNIFAIIALIIVAAGWVVVIREWRKMNR
jgi:uncharacterized membrane protein YcjF (UPF0283 family)